MSNLLMVMCFVHASVWIAGPDRDGFAKVAWFVLMAAAGCLDYFHLGKR